MNSELPPADFIPQLHALADEIGSNLPDDAAYWIDRLSGFVDDPAYDIGMVRGVMRDARDLLATQLAAYVAAEQRMQEFERAGLCWRNPAPNAAPQTTWAGQTARLLLDQFGHMRPTSAIEAAIAGETPQDGSTVGESAVPLAADAQPKGAR